METNEKVSPSENLLLEAFVASLEGDHETADKKYAIYDLALACAKSPAMVAMKDNAERFEKLKWLIDEKGWVLRAQYPMESAPGWTQNTYSNVSGDVLPFAIDRMEDKKE